MVAVVDVVVVVIDVGVLFAFVVVDDASKFRKHQGHALENMTGKLVRDWNQSGSVKARFYS